MHASPTRNEHLCAHNVPIDGLNEWWLFKPCCTKWSAPQQLQRWLVQCCVCWHVFCVFPLLSHMAFHLFIGCFQTMIFSCALYHNNSHVLILCYIKFELVRLALILFWLPSSDGCKTMWWATGFTEIHHAGWNYRRMPTIICPCIHKVVCVSLP